MNKLIQFFITISVLLLGLQNVMADNKLKDKNLFSEIQKELRLAEADMDEDEDLFMDEGEDEMADDWSEEETEEVTEQPAPAPAVEEPAPAPAQEEVVEQPAPEPKPVAVAKPKAQPKVKKKRARVPASFKQGFKVSNSECSLHSEPSNNSSVILNTKGGKKLWLEAVNGSWYKGYHKSGHGYFPASCFH